MVPVLFRDRAGPGRLRAVPTRLQPADLAPRVAALDVRRRDLRASARAFDNPDHVNIVIHNYRWRLGLADGETQYDALERRLAAAPTIAVPTITLEGDANGAPHPPASAYANKFVGKYAHRVIAGGIGHNLPQEAPRAFAQAIVDADAFGS